MNAPGELNPVIHAPTRLRIMATLATVERGDRLSFTRLQELLDLTPGNLITHLRKLEEAGYVDTESSRADGSKTTTVALTDEGRLAYRDYRATLQSWLDSSMVGG